MLILNSYTLTSKAPQDQVRVRCFLEGLAEGGFRIGHNVEVEFIDSNDLETLESQLARALEKPADLIHAVGTPNAIIAAKLGGSIPVVYYGAHPDGVGESVRDKESVSGMVLTLPFTASYKHFRFVRKLFTDVERIYVPFYENTVFCHPEMRARHRRFRTAEPGVMWVSDGSEFLGYRSLAGLCYVIGLQYREFVYRDLDDLRAGLASIDPRRAMMMPYNDSVYCADAPTTLTTFAIERGIPLLWNNNPEATQIGAAAAVAGCFREAGLTTGKMAAAILEGSKPNGVGFVVSQKSFASINMARMRELGLQISPSVLSYFDEVLHGN
ncbi:MAG: hypothetical protein MJE77_30825 [Proteobacteria bacterium]|nr:hypothetical protein [Pseudomonadota bacterium]